DVGRLLANRQMAVAADACARVLLLGALLEPSDQQHHAQQTQRKLAVLQHIAGLIRCLGHGSPSHAPRGWCRLSEVDPKRTGFESNWTSSCRLDGGATEHLARCHVELASMARAGDNGCREVALGE